MEDNININQLNVIVDKLPIIDRYNIYASIPPEYLFSVEKKIHDDLEGFDEFYSKPTMFYWLTCTYTIDMLSFHLHKYRTGYETDEIIFLVENNGFVKIFN